MWSLLIGGLLGTILAVPLTATLKVLLRRYVWERRILRAAQMSMEESRDATPASEATKVSQK
jgi:predicted PurR-regulated permease PerM